MRAYVLLLANSVDKVYINGYTTSSYQPIYSAVYPSVDPATSYLQCMFHCNSYKETIMMHFVYANKCTINKYLTLCDCYLVGQDYND